MASRQLPVHRPDQSWDDYALEVSAYYDGKTPLLAVNAGDWSDSQKYYGISYVSIYMCDISPAFEDARHLPLSGLSPKLFGFYSTFLPSMRARFSQYEGLGEMGWTPIQFNTECYYGEALSELDTSNLLWIDKDLRNFLLINLYPANSKDFDDILAKQAQKLFNLMNYLPMPNGVGFVRATYIHNDGWDPTPEFFTGLATGSTRRFQSRSSNRLPAIIHLSNVKDLIPSLSNRDLQALNSLIRWTDQPPPDQAKRDLVLAAPGKETTSGYDVAKCVPPWTFRVCGRPCGGCNKLMPREKLSKCSQCLLVFYCSKKCQTGNWKKHKILCQWGAVPKKEATESSTEVD